MGTGAIALALLHLTAPRAQPDPRPARPCRTDPRVVGECFEVRGRLHFANGNPALRMWRVGTNRYLGIKDDEEPMVPGNLAALLRSEFDRTIFGDFLVCPFTADRPGWMRMVCIESARNLLVRDASDEPLPDKPHQPTPSQRVTPGKSPRG